MERTFFSTTNGLDNMHDNVMLGKVDSPDGMNPDRTVEILTEAVNIDIYDSGEARRRKGRTLSVASTAPHSGYCSKNKVDCYFVSQGVLKRFYYTGSAYTTANVVTLDNNNRLCYVPINEELVVMNGSNIGWLSGTDYVEFDQTLKEFEAVMPSGQYGTFFRGCLLVAKGDELFVSKPHNPMVVDKRLQEFPLDGYIRMLGAVEDGLWIATDKHVGFIAGKGIDEFEYTPINDFVPADGCFGVWYDNEKEGSPATVYWASRMGFCIGRAGGKFACLSEDKVKLPEADTGFCMMKANNGIFQYIAVLRNNTEGNIFVPETQDVHSIGG